MSMRTQTLIETLVWLLFAVGIVTWVNLCAPEPIHSARVHNHLMLTEGERPANTSSGAQPARHASFRVRGF